MYTSHTQLSLSEKISYSIRKRVNIRYQEYNPATNTTGPPQSLGIVMKENGCRCSYIFADPNCRNIPTKGRTIDFVDKIEIKLFECPKRFDDRKLWSQIYIVLEKIKDWGNIHNYYGIPTIQLPTHLYDFIEEVFQARTRYQNQKEEKEK